MSAVTMADTAATPSLHWWRRKSVGGLVIRGGAFTIALAGAAVFLIPLLWMISASVSTNAEIYMYPPRWVPRRVLLSNFPLAFRTIHYWLYLRNTTIITVLSTVGAVLSASLVAFGFARLRGRGRDALFLILLATMMLPYHVTLVPVYLLFRYIGWVDTYLPLIVPSWLGGGAFFIFLLRQFYATLPQEYDDAARIDGCGYYGIWWRILLPLSKPALATVAIFSFFGNWSDFLGPLIFLNDPNKYTISVGLQFYRSAFNQIQWNLLMAATLVTVLPPLAVFFFAQKAFVQGIVMTGLKG